VLAAMLFHYLQPQYSLGTSFYWAIVTLSTTGYGDVVPLSAAARAMTTVLLFGQIFLGGYLISVITSTVIDERQQEALGTLGTDMHDHIVVLGYTAVGQAAVRELLIQERPVAVVTERPEDVANVRSLAAPKRIFATFGAAADLDILHRVNVPLAHSVIICTADDATNMIASLNVKTLAPKARIVVSVARSELRETLRTAGVTFVASPSDLGGRLCASAAFEPEVAFTLEDITAADVQSDMQEYILTERTPIRGGTIAEVEAKIREVSGVILVGYARRGADGEYHTIVNPPGNAQLGPGDAIILLGQIPSLKRFRSWFGSDQGR
ncbi:MAG: NAD-binding protein, partial [Thermoplasmata archaeon]|nr:NAD-binding protein [Thermoplasmata archaeon]